MIDAKLSSRRMISEEEHAITVPDFIANPTCDFFKAGASFVPSPVTATISLQFYNPVTSKYLSDGVDLAKTFNEDFIFMKLSIF